MVANINLFQSVKMLEKLLLDRGLESFCKRDYIEYLIKQL